MGLFPDLLKFCPQLPGDPVPSHVACSSVLSCPNSLFPAISRFLFKLFQDSVPSWAKVLSLAMFFFFCFFSISLNSLFLFQIPPQLSMHPDPGELWPLGCGLLGPDKSGVIRKDWGHWL